MKETISGRILSYDEENRMISLHVSDKIRYFYIQRSLLNRIAKYIEINRFIQFAITDEERLYRRHKVSTVDYIIKIMQIRYRRNIVYYDVKNIKVGTKALINDLEYKMFLDLEMSMHPYKVDKNFVQEVIQVGYILVDNNDKVIETYNQNIRPTIHKKITKRTIKFLGMTQEEVDSGVVFDVFYDKFKDVIHKYNPGIVVWGRNDFLALNQAYNINHVPSLASKTRYINLLKIHKNFFNLKNDLGLFNALKLYESFDEIQAHNAYEDAEVTRKIFYGFKQVVNNKLNVDISSYK
ncbi:sporulation inhibitor KapD [Candidatus Izimaplasma bacterium HR1]|jgi:sporulation inhibitor KapD|uniref:exonuclease domain-containing protein n=1 Tax=Candidatus Izimoplasma sp. HR1 TaxID=1541959 RepID=UPI0004F7E593|nr:sporulation inhibitor KapD [Candidatus Izimaplasma bacterium HR1]